MTKLYDEEGLLKIKKEKKLFLTLMIVTIALIVSAFICFLLVSTYKTRTLFIILSSIITSIFVLFLVYFVSRFIYVKRVCNEYETLLNSKNTLLECEILERSEFITTLPDKSRCHEVLVKIGDKEKIYYLSEIFSEEEIKPGKCKIIVAFDYLKGYEYES